MPQRVHAVAALLAHRDVSCPRVPDQDLVQVVLIGERPGRGRVPQEHLRAAAGRPPGADVADDRPADVLQQRQVHLAAGLGLGDGQPAARPVEVGELQPLDVDAPQPEPGHQHDDRVIALPARAAPVHRLQDPGHVARVPYRRDPGLLAGRHRGDRLRHRRGGQALFGREPQERPQGAQLLLDGPGLVAGQRGHERPDHRSVAVRQPPARAAERCELPSQGPVGPHRRRAPLGGPQVHLEPGDGPGPVPGYLADRAGVAAQHGPVSLVLAQHLGDPEQVDIGLLERSGLLLREEAAGLIDPRHGHLQRELLRPPGGEIPLQAAPRAPVPDHRRFLVAQTHQLCVQTRHQRRQSGHRPTPDHPQPGTLPGP